MDRTLLALDVKQNMEEIFACHNIRTKDFKTKYCRADITFPCRKIIIKNSLVSIKNSLFES